MTGLHPPDSPSRSSTLQLDRTMTVASGLNAAATLSTTFTAPQRQRADGACHNATCACDGGKVMREECMGLLREECMGLTDLVWNAERADGGLDISAEVL